MNSFIENVNYVANLDNKYGSSIKIYKNNLSLKSVQHDIELKFSYYNNDDKKIHSIVYSEPDVLVGGINDTLLSFKTLVESSITGSEFTCTVSSSVQDFVINNIVMVNINITSNSDIYKTYELEMKVVTAGAVTYDVFGEVSDTLKILPSLARIVGEDIANVNTVATNIVGLNSIVSNITEILLADDNAAIATTKALESSDSAESSLQSALDSAASAALFPNHIADTTNPHEVTKSQVGLEFSENTADIDKVVASAGKLTSAVNISLSGDVSGSVSFDGSNNVSIATTIAANSIVLGTDTTGNYVAGNTAGTGIVVTGTAGEGWSPTIALSNVGTAGTYKSVTTDAQGRVISGTNPTTISGFGISDATHSSHIGSSGTSHGVVTTSVNGFMSSTDKSKLDGIAAGAQANVATDLSLGTATATTIPLNSSTGADVVLPSATTTLAGLLSGTDKTKLDGIAASANNYAHPTSGVGAGTYKSVTVDTNGHITSGTNPTTVSGYGLTDVYTKTEIDLVVGDINSALDTINGQVI